MLPCTRALKPSQLRKVETFKRDRKEAREKEREGARRREEEPGVTERVVRARRKELIAVERSLELVENSRDELSEPTRNGMGCRRALYLR